MVLWIILGNSGAVTEYFHGILLGGEIWILTSNFVPFISRLSRSTSADMNEVIHYFWANPSSSTTLSRDINNRIYVAAWICCWRTIHNYPNNSKWRKIIHILRCGNIQIQNYSISELSNGWVTVSRHWMRSLVPIF